QDTAASRMAAIDDIVAEREQDSHAASKRLRFDLRRHHIGVIAWADPLPDRGDVTTVLTETIGALARFAGAESSLAQPSGARALAGWLTSRRAYAPDLLERMDDATCARGLPDEVRVAVGEPGFDLKGFRQTHVDAGHARRVASLAIPGSVRLTRYRDIAVAAMCTADPDHAAAFVKRVLGRLAADDETSFRLA